MAASRFFSWQSGVGELQWRMPELLPPSIFVIAMLVMVGLAKLDKVKRIKEASGKLVVNEGTAYPNNHQVMGVGFYHASSRRWFVLPWNEFQEGRGYYWDGEWHAEPDQRRVAPTVPDAEEVARVNKEWRREEISHIERFGFGSSERRSQGS